MKPTATIIGGLALALAVAFVVPVKAGACQAFAGYGECYIELTGCDNDDCDFVDQGGGEQGLSGMNCTGYFGTCGGDWSWDLIQSWNGPDLEFHMRVTHIPRNDR